MKKILQTVLLALSGKKLKKSSLENGHTPKIIHSNCVSGDLIDLKGKLEFLFQINQFFLRNTH